MRLSSDTVHAILSRWADEGIVHDYCADYGEPGYSHSYALTDDDTPLVVLGDYWCRCDKFGTDSQGRPELHGKEAHHPRLWAQLADQGVQFEWYDEWAIVHEAGKAYRTQPDSYSWQPSIVWDDDNDEWLTPDDDLETWVAWAANNSSRCIPSVAYKGSDLIGAGFEQHNGKFESGWYPGQTDDPAVIAEEIRRWHDGDVDVVFALDGTGQFDVQFTAYYRPAS